MGTEEQSSSCVELLQPARDLPTTNPWPWGLNKDCDENIALREFQKKEDQLQFLCQLKTHLT